jgi:hypothetical protein
MGKSSSLEALIKKATTTGMPFYRFKMHMEQEAIKELKKHIKDNPAYLCTRGALDPLGEYGGPKISSIFKAAPGSVAAYLAGAYYCSHGVVDGIELYQSSTVKTIRSLIRRINTEITISINLAIILSYSYGVNIRRFFQ